MAKVGRPKRRKFREHGEPLYEEGTPIDEATGAPPEEALIPEDQARNIAMDAESSRMNAQHQTVIRKKSQGVPMTQWSSDPRIKYSQIYRFHPSAKVVIRMIEPYDDDNIPTRYLSQLNNYDRLIQHVKDTHWNGKQAAYKWAVMDDGGKTYGIGVIKFGPQREEQASHQQQQQPMMAPNPMMMMGGNPMMGWGQQWGYPSQQQYQPPHFEQQQLPQPQVQAPPVPAPQYHPDVLTGLLGYVERLTDTVIQQKAQFPHAPQAAPFSQPAAPPGYIAQIPWAMMGQIPPEVLRQIPPQLLPVIFGNGFVPAPQPAPPPQPQAPPTRNDPPQAPPLSPIDAAREAIESVAQMTKMGRDLAKQFITPEAEPPEPAPPPDPDPLPYQIQDIGVLRLIKDRQTGEEVDGLTKFMMNGDKIGNALKSVVSEITDAIAKRQEASEKAQQAAIDQAKQLADVQRQIAESQERIARAKAMQAVADQTHQLRPTTQFVPPPQPAQPQHIVVAPEPSAPPEPFVPPTQPAPPPAPPPPPPSPPEPEKEPEPERVTAPPVMRPIMVVRPEPVKIEEPETPEIPIAPPAETEQSTGGVQ